MAEIIVIFQVAVEVHIFQFFSFICWFERERKRLWLVVPHIHVLTSFFLYVTQLGIKLTTLVCGMMLQPTELPSQGKFIYIILILIQGYVSFIDFREKMGTERERERETSMWERNIYWLLPIYALTGDRTWNLGMCPNQGSNPQHFGVRDDALTNWATREPGPHILKIIFIIIKF